VLEKTDAMHDFEKLGVKKLFPLRKETLVLYAAMSLKSDEKLVARVQASYDLLRKSGRLLKHCQIVSPHQPADDTCNVVQP
jgi:hypothetical protein